MARDFRRKLSLPEAMLWKALRGRSVGGLKFRRQHPCGPFVIDFYCPEAKLAVEVDGASHHDPDRMRSDRQRDGWLSTQGIRVLRFPASYVLTNVDGVTRMIEHAAAGGSRLALIRE